MPMIIDSPLRNSYDIRWDSLFFANAQIDTIGPLDHEISICGKDWNQNKTNHRSSTDTSHSTTYHQVWCSCKKFLSPKQKSILSKRKQPLPSHTMRKQFHQLRVQTPAYGFWPFRSLAKRKYYHIEKSENEGKIRTYSIKIQSGWAKLRSQYIMNQSFESSERYKTACGGTRQRCIILHYTYDG